MIPYLLAADPAFDLVWPLVFFGCLCLIVALGMKGWRRVRLMRARRAINRIHREATEARQRRSARAYGARSIW